MSMDRYSILFKDVFVNFGTYVSNCQYWWKQSKRIETETGRKNTWRRKYTGFTEIMPMFEFHCENKVILVNQYNPYEIQGEFDERKYITAYLQRSPSEDDPTECFVVWLVMTRLNVATAIDAMKRFLLNDSSLNHKLQEIYSHHEAE